ncbi:MAG: hypothetical protein GPW18_06005 [Euryarchaeota archaeon]|nr:hypothetical protein [Euryarchaeota archaeon]
MDLCNELNSNQCEALDALAKFLKENDKYSKIVNDLINSYSGDIILLLIINYITLRDMVLNDPKLRDILLGKDNIIWL